MPYLFVKSCQLQAVILCGHFLLCHARLFCCHRTSLCCLYMYLSAYVSIPVLRSTTCVSLVTCCLVLSKSPCPAYSEFRYPTICHVCVCVCGRNKGCSVSLSARLVVGAACLSDVQCLHLPVGYHLFARYQFTIFMSAGYAVTYDAAMFLGINHSTSVYACGAKMSVTCVYFSPLPLWFQHV